MLSSSNVKRWWASAMVLAGILGWGSPAQAQVIANLDMEDATVVGSNNWGVIDNGIYYREKGIDRVSVSAPWLSPWVANPNPSAPIPLRSLKFEHNANTTAAKQRVEIVAKEGEPFNQWRYVGYDFAIGPDTGAPTGWTVITQFHQEGHFVSPIGELTFEPDGSNMKLVMKIRNSNYFNISGVTPTSGNPNHTSKPIWDVIVPKNQWRRIVVGFRPDGAIESLPADSGTGRVKIWYGSPNSTFTEADSLVLNWTGKLGFPAGFKGFPFVTTYYNCFGIYRAGNQNFKTLMYFDAYKWGHTFADVKPQ